MSKSKYEVVRPWFGVVLGQIVEFDKVPNALVANVRPANAVSAQGELDPKAVADAKKEAKAIVAEATKEAERIVAEARAASEMFLPGDVAQTGELTPATPDATGNKAAAKKTT